MFDWIKDRAAAIRTAEKEKKEERDRQIEAANVLKAKAGPFWNSLIDVLQDSVRHFNSEFPETERQIDHFDRAAPLGVTIRRTNYPSAIVKAQMNNGATSVNYSISRTFRKGTDPVEKQGNLSLIIRAGEIGYAEGVAVHEDVAKLFLEPFFQF